MRFRTHILALALLLLLATGRAWGQQNVWIEGTSDNAAGKRIALYGYADMLTMEELLLDSTTVDSTGAFRLATYANYPRLVFLQVDNYSQSFYIEPSRHYRVYLPTFDWNVDEQHNVYLDPVALPVEFLDLPPDELNLRILRMDQVVDSVMALHRVHLDARFRPDRRYFDTLAQAVLRAVPAEGGSFLQRYRDFRLAQMRLAMGFESRKKLFARYIDGQDILYYDENYMRLFFDLAAGTISMGTRRVPMWRMAEWMEEGNLRNMLDSVGLDPLYRHEQVRELAVVQALKEAYYNPAYSRSAVQHIVALLASATKFADHRQLAERLLREFDRQQGGTTVAPVVLPDVDRHPVGLDSFRGKWVYMAFVRVGDPNCLSEIETMAHFHDTVCGTGQVEFVSVSCDREFLKMYHFLKSRRKSARYQWPWLHFDGNYDLLQLLGVVSYPTFVLVNPEGRVVSSYAPAPASGFLLRGPWRTDGPPNTDIQQQ